MSPGTDLRYQMVRCCDCEREYVCTPADDNYDVTTDRDGVCFACLLRRHNLRTVEPPVLVVADDDPDPLFRLNCEAAIEGDT